MRSAEIQELGSFLIEANLEGYGNPEVEIQPDAKGGSAIQYEKGRWSFYDHFFGGEPYAGQEVIYRSGIPVWAMQYRGWLSDTTLESKAVYAFLREALLRAPEEHPYRGPTHYRHKDLTYNNEWQGSLSNFSGRETICIDTDQSVSDSRVIYEGLYFGGLIDR